MGQITLQGSITVGPPNVSETTFPGAVSSVLLTTNPSPKSSAVDTGIKHRNVNSPNSFESLSGVGPSDDVTQGAFFYFKCQSPMMLRVTTANPLVPMSPLVSEIPIAGTCIIEPPQSNYITLIEVQGVGQAEYFASGQQ